MILNIGSINIDHVYEVEHFLKPGETLGSSSYRVYAGGKGSNQSIALARAGAEVLHAGRIGKNDIWVRDMLSENGVDTRYVDAVDEPGGHAIIQVDHSGENCILLYGGANLGFTEEYIEACLSGLGYSDTVLLQNEINNLGFIIDKCFSAGVPLAFNPAPMSESVKQLPLDKLSYLIVNRIEGEQLSGHSEPDEIIRELLARCPSTAIILTLGAEGVIYADAGQRLEQPAVRVPVVDTTAAGDTFIGFFLHELTSGNSIGKSLETAVLASSICVGRKGASVSIPLKSEL